MLNLIRLLLQRILDALGGVYNTTPIVIPGLTTGGAYATGDALGVQFTIPVPKSGILHAVWFIDRDNEKIAKEIMLAGFKFTATANDAAFAPVGSELDRMIPVRIAAGDFGSGYNANAIGYVSSLGIPYTAPEGMLYCQLVTRGADNIAAGSEPLIKLGII